MGIAKTEGMVFLFAVLFLNLYSIGTEIPPRVKLPLLVWDVNFNDNPLDLPPQPLSKEKIEALGKLSEWERLPVRTCSGIEHITETRQATVVKEAGGLKDKPLLFTYTENAQPQYGPLVRITVPLEVAKHGALWKLSFDVAKTNIAISGGIHLWDIAGIEFFEDGTVRVGEAQISRYAANKPLHIECMIDAVKRTAKITVDGNNETSVTVPWRYQKGESFNMLILHGVLPGGHGETPSPMVFDNIKLVMEEWK